jgi:hypothetical protein
LATLPETRCDGKRSVKPSATEVQPDHRQRVLEAVAHRRRCPLRGARRAGIAAAAVTVERADHRVAEAAIGVGHIRRRSHEIKQQRKHAAALFGRLVTLGRRRAEQDVADRLTLLGILVQAAQACDLAELLQDVGGDRVDALDSALN